MALLEILRTPGGTGPVTLDADTLTGPDGSVVARVAGQTLDFIDLEPRADLSGSGPFLGCEDEAFDYLGDWALVDGVRCGEAFAADIAIMFRVDSDFRLHFRRQPWSGWVAVLIDGKVVGEFDLFDAYSVVPLAVSFVRPNADRPSTVLIKPLKRRSLGSAGFQVFFEGVTLLEPGSAHADPVSEAASVWPDFFTAALNEVGEGWVLDFGSAGRRSADPRVVSLSARALNLPDLRSPLERIPIADAQIAMAFAWHSLGRAGNPVAAISELSRVTRPGGRLLAAVPAVTPPAGATHFFSFTAAGLRALLEPAWDITEIRPWGSPSDVVARVIDATGANVRSYERANALKTDAQELWSRFPPESEMTAVSPFLIVDGRRRPDPE